MCGIRRSKWASKSYVHTDACKKEFKGDKEHGHNSNNKAVARVHTGALGTHMCTYTHLREITLFAARASF